MDKGFLQIPVLTLPYKQQKVLTKRTNIALSSGDLVKQIQMNRLAISYGKLLTSNEFSSFSL